MPEGAHAIEVTAQRRELRLHLLHRREHGAAADVIERERDVAELGEPVASVLDLVVQASSASARPEPEVTPPFRTTAVEPGQRRAIITVVELDHGPQAWTRRARARRRARLREVERASAAHVAAGPAMMPGKKILCPVDFSSGSQHAGRAVAIRLANEGDAELVLAHAWCVPAMGYGPSTLRAEVLM